MVRKYQVMSLRRLDTLCISIGVSRLKMKLSLKPTIFFCKLDMLNTKYNRSFASSQPAYFIVFYSYIGIHKCS